MRGPVACMISSVTHPLRQDFLLNGACYFQPLGLVAVSLSLDMTAASGWCSFSIFLIFRLNGDRFLRGRTILY